MRQLDVLHRDTLLNRLIRQFAEQLEDALYSVSIIQSRTLSNDVAVQLVIATLNSAIEECANVFKSATSMKRHPSLQDASYSELEQGISTLVDIMSPLLSNMSAVRYHCVQHLRHTKHTV